MQIKKPLIISITIALIITVGVVLLLSSRKQEGSNYEYDQYGSKTPEEAARMIETEGVANTNTATVIATTTTTTTTNQATSTVKVFSMADIAIHSSEADCWTSIDGNVYDLTQFIKEHPGGRRAILGLCGKDGSADFHDAHGKGGRAQTAVFIKYKIGIVQ